MFMADLTIPVFRLMLCLKQTQFMFGYTGFEDPVFGCLALQTFPSDEVFAR